MRNTSRTFPASKAICALKRTLLLAMLVLAATACERSGPAAKLVPVRPAPVEDLSFLQRQDVGSPIADHPWIAHVRAVDLDGDGRMDILACEAKDNQLLWLRQTAPGKFEEQAIASELPGIVHVDAVDMTGSGHLDLIVSCMGVVFPNNDKIGSIIILENDGHQHFTKHVIAENIARVCDVRAGDFNGDGKLDLAVGQFGYDQGEIQWMENLGNWRFKSHHLLDLSGTINVCAAAARSTSPRWSRSSGRKSTCSRTTARGTSPPSFCGVRPTRTTAAAAST